MKFALQHGIGDPRWSPLVLHPDEIARFVEAAASAGFDAIAFTDHPAPSGRWVDAGGEGVADAFTSLAYCAALNRTISLLTWVLVPPFRNPFLTAHAAATLDRLSNGRLVLGTGTGYLRSEFLALGVDMTRRRELFEEAIATMRSVWSGEDVTREGMSFSATGVRSVPRPIQVPHPPIWVHGNSRWGLEYAAHHADGWIGMVTSAQHVRTIRTHGIADLDALARRIDTLAIECEHAGRSIDDLTLSATGMWPMFDLRERFDPVAMCRDVRRLSSMGISWAVNLVCGDDPDVAIATIHRFGEDVIAATRGT